MTALPNVRELGGAVREARRKAGWTQADLARAARVGREWVVRLEGGASRAELGLVLNVFRVLGLQLVAEPRPQPAGPDLLDEMFRSLR